MHNQNQEARPGYKWTKLGWVPVEWEVVKLSKLFEIKHGFAFKSEYFSNEGSFVVTTPGHFYAVGGFRRRSNYEKRYSGEFPKEYILKKGDLIVAMTEQGPGLLGSTAKIPCDNLYLHNQRLGLIENIAEILLDKDYLYYALNSRAIRENIAKESSGTKVKHTSPKRILNLQTLLPPLPEQQKIATILSTWDRAIALTRQLIAAKEEQKKGLMQRLLTGKVRVAGFVGEWEECRLGELFDERKETGFIELPLLAITADRGVIYRDELDKKDTSNEDKSKYKRICPGDIGYNTMRMWQGRSAVSNLEGIVSPAYTVIVPKPEVDVGFMGRLFHLPKIILAFWRYSQGLVNDTLNCKFSSFSLVKVYVPCNKEEQVAIGNILKSFDEELELLNRKACALQEQKQGLMQQLLTGQIRVRV